MAQLTAQIVSYDDEFKRQISHLLRACGVPVGIVEGRSAEGTAPDLVVVDIRADASSGMAAIERLRASSAEPGGVRDCGRARAGADPPGDARRGQRVLPLECGRRIGGGARDRRVVPRRGPADRGAPRGGQRRRQAAVRHARVPRREGRRRHDHRRGQLRRRARAPDQAADGDRRPQGRVSARSRSSSACGRASPCSTRSRTCTGSTRTS